MNFAVNHLSVMTGGENGRQRDWPSTTALEEIHGCLKLSNNCDAKPMGDEL